MFHRFLILTSLLFFLPQAPVYAQAGNATATPVPVAILSPLPGQALQGNVSISALAAERRWVPWRLRALEPTLPPGLPQGARVAFVAEGAEVSAQGWQEVGREGRWRLLRR